MNLYICSKSVANLSAKVSCTAPSFIITGLARIPEEERISILKSQGISDESLSEEAKSIEELNWNRLQSIASP